VTDPASHWSPSEIDDPNGSRASYPPAPPLDLDAIESNAMRRRRFCERCNDPATAECVAGGECDATRCGAHQPAEEWGHIHRWVPLDDGVEDVLALADRVRGLEAQLAATEAEARTALDALHARCDAAEAEAAHLRAQLAAAQPVLLFDAIRRGNPGAPPDIWCHACKGTRGDALGVICSTCRGTGQHPPPADDAPPEFPIGDECFLAGDDTGRLLNLLATIHRDGGHRVSAVGIAQACRDAVQVLHALRHGGPMPPPVCDYCPEPPTAACDDCGARLCSLHAATPTCDDGDPCMLRRFPHPLRPGDLAQGNADRAQLAALAGARFAEEHKYAAGAIMGGIAHREDVTNG